MKFPAIRAINNYEPTLISGQNKGHKSVVLKVSTGIFNISSGNDNKAPNIEIASERGV